MSEDAPIVPSEINTQEEQPAATDATDASGELGGVAVEAGIQGGGHPPDDFHRDTPDILYSEHGDKARELTRAEKNADPWKDVTESSGLRRRLRHTSAAIEQAAMAEKALAKAKEEYDQQLERAKQYADKTHEQANEYVDAYQKYIDTQEKLAEITGAPVLTVMEIEDMIRNTAWGRKYSRDSLDYVATYAALKDFLTPDSSQGASFDGKYPKYNKPLPRIDIGSSLEKAIEQAKGNDDAKLLRITDISIPGVRHGYYTYETVKSAPRQSERYLILSPALEKLFDDVSPDTLNFETDLYYERNLNSHNNSAEVGSKFDIVSVKDAMAEMEVAKLPHKAVLTYEKDMGRDKGTAWQQVEIRAEDEQQLRERVLTHLLENLDLADITVDGQRIPLKDFLAKNEESPAPETVAA